MRFSNRFLFNTIPAFNDNRPQRFVTPGLFEEWVPRGIDFFGSNHAIISYMSAPGEVDSPIQPSLLVVINLAGKILQLVEIRLESGDPFIGTASDVAYDHDHNYVWVGDDGLELDENGNILGRFSDIIRIRLPDPPSSPQPPIVLDALEEATIEVPPSGLFYESRACKWLEVHAQTLVFIFLPLISH